MTQTDSPHTVLVVDDERGLADLYSEWLADDYEVRTAYSGQEALEKIDQTLDFVLLDRRMPDLSGDEVLGQIRDQGVAARVAMVTAVEPDFDIVEMGFDDYLVKPVVKEDLYEPVRKKSTLPVNFLYRVSKVFSDRLNWPFWVFRTD